MLRFSLTIGLWIFCFALVFVIGCGSQEPVQKASPIEPIAATPQPVPPPPPPPPSPPSPPTKTAGTIAEAKSQSPDEPKKSPVDPKREEFKKRMLEFIQEARAVCNLIETGPSQIEYRRYLSKVTDAYARLPDAPSKLELYREAAKILHNGLQANTDRMSIFWDAVRLKRPDLANEILAGFKESGKSTRETLGLLEDAITKGIIPRTTSLPTKQGPEAATLTPKQIQEEAEAKAKAEKELEERGRRDREAIQKLAAKAKYESDASRKLTLAKNQLEEGREKLRNEKTAAEGRKVLAFARARLEEIIRDFPEAKATIEAKKLLAELAK